MTALYFQPDQNAFDEYDIPSFVVWADFDDCRASFPDSLIIALSGDDVEDPTYWTGSWQEGQARLPRETLYVCAECDSPDVQECYPAWFEMNTGEPVNDEGGETIDYYCPECGESCDIEEVTA